MTLLANPAAWQALKKHQQEIANSTCAIYLQDPQRFERFSLRLGYYDWHFNVRPSNTEPLLRLNLEAKSKALMEEKRDQILDIIRA